MMKLKKNHHLYYQNYYYIRQFKPYGELFLQEFLLFQQCLLTRCTCTRHFLIFKILEMDLLKSY